MQKLFELLKLHCRKKYMFGDNDEIEIDCDSVSFHLYFKGKRLFPLRYETIICKEFGFIKRLVDNEHIDRYNQALQYAKSDLSKFFTEWKDKNGMSDDYAMLLMLLAIQDEPIEFLISILK